MALAEGAMGAGTRLQIIDRRPLPPDFPTVPAFPEGNYLKFAVAVRGDTQIIVEEESKGGQTLLPIPFLRQLISFYGDSLQGVVPQYLEMSMAQFSRNQEQMRRYMQNAFGFNPFQQFEAMGKQNMAMFENAMKMFAPFGGEQNWAGKSDDMPNPFAAFTQGSQKASGSEAKKPSRDAEIDELKDQIAAMREQIASLAQKK